MSLKVRYKSATVNDFIEQQSVNVSRGGMFIRTDQPLPVGTLLKLELQLRDRSSVIQGVGRVVWKCPKEVKAEIPPGMGVKFIKMHAGSRDLVQRIVEERGGQDGVFEAGIDDDRFPQFTSDDEQTAVRDVSEFMDLARKTAAEAGLDFGKREQSANEFMDTPVPPPPEPAAEGGVPETRPMPFLADFAEAFSNEPTRVGDVEELLTDEELADRDDATPKFTPFDAPRPPLDAGDDDGLAIALTQRRDSQPAPFGSGFDDSGIDTVIATPDQIRAAMDAAEEGRSGSRSRVVWLSVALVVCAAAAAAWFGAPALMEERASTFDDRAMAKPFVVPAAKQPAAQTAPLSPEVPTVPVPVLPKPPPPEPVAVVPKPVPVTRSKPRPARAKPKAASASSAASKSPSAAADDVAEAEETEADEEALTENESAEAARPKAAPLVPVPIPSAKPAPEPEPEPAPATPKSPPSPAE